MTSNIDGLHDTAWQTRFGTALRWRIHDPDEALGIAASHRAQAREARQGMPDDTSTFRDRSRALGLESRAERHDEIAAVGERHAEELRNLGRSGP